MRLCWWHDISISALRVSCLLAVREYSALSLHLINARKTPKFQAQIIIITNMLIVMRIFFITNIEPGGENGRAEWQLEGFYASRRFWSLPSMPTGITARTPPTLVPGLGDSSWIVVCRPPSDLSSLYEAGVNIRAGNKLFIWSVPAFVNSSSKKRVNVQFCLRLRLADKVSLDRSSPEMS